MIGEPADLSPNTESQSPVVTSNSTFLPGLSNGYSWKKVFFFQNLFHIFLLDLVTHDHFASWEAHTYPEIILPVRTKQAESSHRLFM